MRRLLRNTIPFLHRNTFKSSTIIPITIHRNFSLSRKFLYNFDRAIGWYQIGMQEASMGNTHKAIDYLTRALLENSENDDFRIHVVRELIFNLIRLNKLEEAEFYINHAKTSLRDDSNLFKGIQAIILAKKHKIEEALRLFEKSIPEEMDEDDCLKWATLCRELSSVLIEIGKYEDAIELLENGLELLEVIEYKDESVYEILKKISKDLAYAHYYNNQPSEAMIYFEEAISLLQFSELESDQMEYLKILPTLGEMQIKSKDLIDDAFENAETARKMIYHLMKEKKLNGNLLDILIRSLIIQSKYYNLKMEFDKALSLSNNVLKLAEKIPKRKIEILLIISEINLNKNDINGCKKKLKISEKLIEKLNIKDQTNYKILHLEVLSNLLKKENKVEELINVLKSKLTHMKKIYSFYQQDINSTYLDLITIYSKIGDIKGMEDIVRQYQNEGNQLSFDMKISLADGYLSKNENDMALYWLRDLLKDFSKDREAALKILPKMVICLKNLKRKEESLKYLEELMNITEKEKLKDLQKLKKEILKLKK